MPTNKERITANLDTEDYQWLHKKAELTGNSKAGILRQMVRAMRLGRPELLSFGRRTLVFAEEPDHTVEVEAEETDTAHERSGLEAFNTE